MSLIDNHLIHREWRRTKKLYPVAIVNTETDSRE